MIKPPDYHVDVDCNDFVAYGMPLHLSVFAGHPSPDGAISKAIATRPLEDDFPPQKKIMRQVLGHFFQYSLFFPLFPLIFFCFSTFLAQNAELLAMYVEVTNWPKNNQHFSKSVIGPSHGLGQAIPCPPRLPFYDVHVNGTKRRKLS